LHLSNAPQALTSGVAPQVLASRASRRRAVGRGEKQPLPLAQACFFLLCVAFRGLFMPRGYNQPLHVFSFAALQKKHIR